ncbi:MAG: hypothetical protein R3277_10905 [Brumimicrobium sp.]|nr:hypothetical protein [Brumimicrobium sp.]
MKNILLSTLTLVLLLIFSGCKKCDPSNEESGLVIENAIVRVIGGQGGANFITDATQYNAPIEVSFDGGITYEPVDFTKYSVFSLPTTANCSSGYNRSVLKNDAAQVVTYSITVTECDYCDDYSITIMNWVLTGLVPGNYTPIFEVNKN